MILKALTLENFKGIREPVRVEFAPVTLLFGPNNAGKSTIVQALHYAREVFERNNTDAGRTQLGGDIVDLGGFKNLVHGHDLSRVIRMRFELDLSDEGLPEYSGWVEKNELEFRIWDLSESEKLDISSVEKVYSRLQKVWVEVEVSWNRELGPHVSSYSVGNGKAAYATITIAENNEEGGNRACLSYFDFGTYPFGTRYSQAFRSPGERELTALARSLVRANLPELGSPEWSLTKGATVGIQGEEVQEGKNKMSREDFDRIVFDIVQGNGEWGDDSIDEETGEKNARYLKRQQLVEIAEAKVAADRALRLSAKKFLRRFDATTNEKDSDATTNEKDSSVDAALNDSEPYREEISVSPELDKLKLGELDVGENTRPHDEGEPELEVVEETDGWMLDLFDALVESWYIRTSDDDPMPLKQKCSALPEWGQRLEFDSRIWVEAKDKNSDYQTYLIFSREYLKNLLTAIVVGPGEGLLNSLKDSIYLSPFREMPPRHYQPAHSPEPRRWANGLAAWDWMMLKGKELVEPVNEWLAGEDRFNAGYKVEVTHYRELDIDSPLMAALSAVEPPPDFSKIRQQVDNLPEGKRLQIRDGRSGVALFPQDLGVGVSQVIPVLVAALYNKQGVVMIEEPESNIHPAFQVVLADLFMTQAKANPQVLFLVETHSEHLMLRCLRRIRESAKGILPEGLPVVRPEDVAVHFVESTKDGPDIHRIEIDEEGDFIDDWPGGFFEESYREKFAGR